VSPGARLEPPHKEVREHVTQSDYSADSEIRRGIGGYRQIRRLIGTSL
jgi:hypothetical protein